MHVCICMCMYIFICVHICVCIYMYMYIHMYMYIYTHIHRHIHTFVQTHVRTCLYETKLYRNRYYCQKTWRTHKIGHKVCPRIQLYIYLPHTHAHTHTHTHIHIPFSLSFFLTKRSAHQMMRKALCLHRSQLSVS